MGRFIIISLILLVLGNSLTTVAQANENEAKSSLALFFGPSVSYYHGVYSDEFDEFKSGRTNFQINGFIGISSEKTQGSATAIGIYGTGGYSNKTTFKMMAEYAGVDIDQVISSRYNSYYQIEGGLLIVNTLRLSSGIGKQYYTTSGGDASFNYLSSTAGFLINLGSVLWSLDANFNYSRDYSDTILKLSTGFMFVF